MKRILTIVSIFLLLAFFSCGPAMNVRHSNKRSGIVRVKQFTDKNTTFMWAHHDPTQRQTMMYVDSLGNIKVLAEQSPDAALERVINADPKFKNKLGLDIGLILKIQSEIENLTNRSTSLMITRESLYRLSESYFNGAITEDKYIELFGLALTTSAELMSQEVKLENAKTKTLEAEKDKLIEEIKKLTLEIKKIKSKDKKEEESEAKEKENKDKSDSKKN